MMSKEENKGTAGRMLAAALCAGALAGCSTVSNWVSPGKPSGPQAKQQVLGADAAEAPHVFEFIQGDDAGMDAERFGSGVIVVSREGQELQSIEHVFDMPLAAIGRSGWIRFEDLDGDGWQDFVVPAGVVQETGIAVMAVHRFDPGKGAFEFVEPLSHWGEVQASGPGCVQVRYAHGELLPAQGRFCYSTQAGRWVQQLSAAEAVAAVAEDGETACASATPDLQPCRKARVALDKAVLAQWSDYSKDRRQVLAQSNGRSYATQFARTSQASHNAWLRYRDARCTAHVREQALPATLFQSATEACKHGMALQQMQHYKGLQARLRIAAGNSGNASASN